LFLVTLDDFVFLQIRDAVPKPHAQKETPLNENFNVKFMTFNYSIFLLLDVLC
jgi:hypothetical protein